MKIIRVSSGDLDANGVLTDEVLIKKINQKSWFDTLTRRKRDSNEEVSIQFTKSAQRNLISFSGDLSDQSIIDLDFSDCESLTSISGKFPKRLQYLTIDRCFHLKSFPEGLFPEEVEMIKLSVKSSALTFLPGTLPKRVKTLSIFRYDNESLSVFPEYLEKLNLLHPGIKSISNLPQTLKEARFDGGYELEIDKFPAELKSLFINYSSIKSLPTFPEKLEYLRLEDCKLLTKLPEPLSPNLSSITIYDSGITSLPQHFPDNLVSIDIHRCNSLPSFEIENNGIRSIYFKDCKTLKNVRISNCPQLHSLDLAGCYVLEDLVIDGCKILTEFKLSGNHEIKNININECPSLTDIRLSIEQQRVEMLSITKCEQLTRFGVDNNGYYGGRRDLKEATFEECPELRDIDLSKSEKLVSLNILGCPKLKNINLSDCQELTSLPNELFRLEILDSLDLSGCDKLVFDDRLTKELQNLEDRGCRITWPRSFESTKVQKVLSKLRTILAEYKTTQPAGAPNFLELITRYMKECISARGGIDNVATEVGEFLSLLQNNPAHLEWIEKISGYFLEGCVNQPVAGFNRIAAWLSITGSGELEDKVKSVERIMVLNNIAEFVVKELGKDREARSNVNFMSAVEVEAGNSLLIALHQKLLNDKIITKPWSGVPPRIAYEGTVDDWVKKKVDKLYPEIKKIFEKPLQEMLDFICVQHENESLANSDIFAKVAFKEDEELAKIEKDIKGRIDVVQNLREEENKPIPSDLSKDIPTELLDDYVKEKDRLLKLEKLFKALELFKQKQINERVKNNLHNHPAIHVISAQGMSSRQQQSVH